MGMFSASFRHGEPINTVETDGVWTPSSSRKPGAHTYTHSRIHTHTQATQQLVSKHTGAQTRLPMPTFKIKLAVLSWA